MEPFKIVGRHWRLGRKKPKRFLMFAALQGLGCLLLLALFSGCALISPPVTSGSVEFLPYNLDEANDWMQPGFEGNAWVVQVNDFYTYGSSPLSMFWSIANVEPNKTTIYLNGVIIQTLAGTEPVGRKIWYKEVWDVEGREPFPATHPIRHLRGPASRLPISLLILTDADGKKIRVFPIEVLDHNKQIAAWRHLLDAAIQHQQTKTGQNLAGFHFAAKAGMRAGKAYEAVEVLTREEAEQRIADLIKQGKGLHLGSISSQGKNWLVISWE